MNKSLKNKIECFDGRPHIDGKHFEDCDMYFAINSVKLAVERLKERVDMLIVENVKSWERGERVVYENKIHKFKIIIDETFPDLKFI